MSCSQTASGAEQRRWLCCSTTIQWLPGSSIPVTLTLQLVVAEPQPLPKSQRVLVAANKASAPAALQMVSDKLISVFASKNLKEWRKLIAHSSQWPTLAPNVFAR